MIKLKVYEFPMGDVEDPEIYVAEPLYRWEKETEQGQWVMEHAVERPVFYIGHCMLTYGYRCRVEAILSDEDATFFQLKWGNN
jgi:hypothetical protein